MHQRQQHGLLRGTQPQCGQRLGQLFFQHLDQIIIRGPKECQQLNHILI